MHHLRAVDKKKKTTFFGNFPQIVRLPPPPPLGDFNHFSPIFFGLVGNFWVIFRCFKGVFRTIIYEQQILGIGRPPRPPFPKKCLFFGRAP